MTMHRAEGIEFSRVLVFGVDEGLVPAECLLKDLPEAERADAVKRRRSLLYVAATRDRDEFRVTTGGRPSPFLNGSGTSCCPGAVVSELLLWLPAEEHLEETRGTADHEVQPQVIGQFSALAQMAE